MELYESVPVKRQSSSIASGPKGLDLPFIAKESTGLPETRSCAVTILVALVVSCSTEVAPSPHVLIWLPLAVLIGLFTHQGDLSSLPPPLVGPTHVCHKGLFWSLAVYRTCPCHKCVRVRCDQRTRRCMETRG
jgi:hypothetical protein